jgi:drug/metabolite transporter (DMT)-like permease
VTGTAAPDRQRLKGIAFGLAAAVLFGASTPLSKRLLPGTGALLLAGLLYLGAGCSLTLYRLWTRRAPSAEREARLRRDDLGLIAAVLVLGGVLGPILMLLGLRQLSAVAGALLLNLEAPLTILLAVAFFGEHLGRREAAAAVLILGGAALLGYQPGEFGGGWIGVLCIAGACLAWALDNNLTGRLALRDPIAVTQMKTLGAGTVNLALALALASEAARPSPSLLVSAMLVGTVSYGVSLVLHLQALRILGAARQAAYFATAPFAGALLAVALLGERPTAADLFAAGLITIGVVLLARAQHGHAHTHEALVHDHLHVHDAHHQHAHDGSVSEPHAHPHRHEPITHDHPHASDPHHRHKH